MKELQKIEVADELLKAFKEMPQARTDYVLRELVIGQHDTTEQQYAHCVLETRNAYNSLRRSKIFLEKTNYEIEELKKKKDRSQEYELQEKEIDREEHEYAVISKLREFNCLYKLWQSFPKKFTREETNANQKEYWDKRAIRQANQDLIGTGRVGIGNQDLLRQIGKPVTPQLDHVKDIEYKYIEGENSNTKIMIAVATEEKADKGLPCLEGLIFPTGMQVRIYNCYGRSVADAYTDIVREFLKDGADYLLTVEDDTFPPPDALIRLMRHISNGKKVVGAWYPMRNETGDGVPIALDKNGKRGQLSAGGKVHEVYTLPMGCTLYSSEVFYKIAQPWFQTTGLLSQDSFFSQNLREAGYTLYCDTSIRCKHVDRKTGKVYQHPNDVKKVLNVGGGNKNIKLPVEYTGWEHTLLDINPEVEGVDIVADAVSMPINGERFDSVYCSHNLEHYKSEDIPKVLENFKRVLKPDGFVCIKVPDIEALDKKIEVENLTPESFLHESPTGSLTVKDVKEGFQKEIEAGNEWYRHRTSFTRELLESIISEAGFDRVEINKNNPLELVAIAYSNRKR